MLLQDLFEGKEDVVLKMIQKEMWPLAKRLELHMKSGKVLNRPDSDGAVLQASRDKAHEIIDKYIGDNAGQHHRAVDQASSYQAVQHLLTNVLLKNSGLGVVR